MSTIKTEISDSIGIITFHNPPYNFMTAAMVQNLDRITREWEQAIVITSDIAGVFISHYEIKDILAMFKPLQITPDFLRGINTGVCLIAGRLIRALINSSLWETGSNFSS